MAAWRIHHESVSHDLLNGEVVAIHLGTGIYYSMRGSAAAIWQMLASPVDIGGMVEALAAACGRDRCGLEGEVSAFLERLRAENLIVEEAFAGSVVAPAMVGQAYAPPGLERFADLQDLLLLDPIHDVGAQGWPNRPPPLPRES